MFENYIFSGLGYAVGSHRITNDDLELAVHKGYLEGFSDERIRSSRGYKEFLQTYPGVSPFSYFTEYKMGFKIRHHVSPFPPGKTKAKNSQSSLDLGVTAISNALKDAQIHPEEIDAWIVSTVSPHEQAPGLASTIKSYFVNFQNQSPTITLTSGCSGFNVNLQRALEFFRCNPGVQHVVVAHTETMSRFMTEIDDFVPFVTFGDAATAVVMSRTHTQQKEGLLAVVNYQDLRMIDSVGVDKDWNLYMNNAIVKDRATVNILKSAREVLEKSGWQPADVDMLVPHQTGDSILKPAAKELGVRPDRLYQEVQKSHGNVSGLGVPLGLSLLKRQGMLSGGLKILSPMAGVGGEYGAFSYLVPETASVALGGGQIKELKGKTALLTGCTGGLGEEIAKELAQKGAKLILQYNSSEIKANKLAETLKETRADFDLFKADFSRAQEVEKFISQVKTKYEKVDFVVLASGVSGGLHRASDVPPEMHEKVVQINQFAPEEIVKQLKSVIKECILYIGSVAEDAQFPGSASYVAAKKALHGFAASFSGEAASAGIRSIYYMPGLVDTGMTKSLNRKQIGGVLMEIKQDELLLAQEVAERIVRSLYIPKVPYTKNSYENAMIVRRDGYRKF